MTRRTGWLLLAALALLGAGSARADVVDVCQASGNGTGQQIPNCEVQTMAPVSYGFWETKSWAYYCTGDHPYYWGAEWSGYVTSFNWNQSGYTGVENPFSETPGSFDGSFTRWQLFTDPLTVNLACSSQAQPDVQGCQSNGAGPVGDPGCPQANVHNYCSRGPVPVCFQTFTESCTNGASYDCNDQFGVIWCNQCAEGSQPRLSIRARAEQAAQRPE